MQKKRKPGDDNPSRNDSFTNQSPSKPRGSKRKAKRRLRFATMVLVILLLVGCGAGWYVFASPLQTHSRILPADSNTQDNPNSQDLAEQDRINVLLIGTDTRPGEALNGSNTDSLILASLDMKNKRIEMLSIPRDTLVDIPGHGKDKINTCLAIGGVQLTERVVANLLDQPIDFYAITKFGGVKEIVDAIGGVTINVDRNMYYVTGDKEDGVINLKKGLQTLNGTQALEYVRFREDALGDIQRTMRQQTFLKALKDKLLSVQTIPKLPWLIPQFFKMVDTNLPQADALKLASRAKVYSEQPLIHETLPGSFIEPNGISYWEINPAQAKYEANQFFNYGKITSNPVQDPSITENWQPPAQGSSGQTVAQNTNQNSNQTMNQDSNTGSTNNQSSTSGDTQGSDSGSPSEANTPASPSTNGSDAVALDDVNVRSGPGTDYSIISSLSGGQHVTLLEKDDTWDKVQLSDGRVGYVAGYYLSTP
jgi:polyisoprenyl-teichoic acid--peptidoglycan teichoic acid transferase